MPHVHVSIVRETTAVLVVQGSGGAAFGGPTLLMIVIKDGVRKRRVKKGEK